MSRTRRAVRTEKKEYQQFSPTERSGKEPTAKHRFPNGFHRGLELFGQQASRLQEPGYREFIQKRGLIIVEGFNDVIGLDNLGIPARGIMSNRMTDAQGGKILRFTKQLSINRVSLMFECDRSGTEGAKEALWFFAELQLDVRLVWFPTVHDGKFNGKPVAHSGHALLSGLGGSRCEARSQSLQYSTNFHSPSI